MFKRAHTISKSKTNLFEVLELQFGKQRFLWKLQLGSGLEGSFKSERKKLKWVGRLLINNSDCRESLHP